MEKSTAFKLLEEAIGASAAIKSTVGYLEGSSTANLFSGRITGSATPLRRSPAQWPAPRPRKHIVAISIASFHKRGPTHS